MMRVPRRCVACVIAATLLSAPMSATAVEAGDATAAVDPASAAPAIRVEDSDTRVSKAGVWATRPHAAFSAGAFTAAARVGAVVSGRFRGTRLTVVGARGPAYGKYEVLIDGVSCGTADCYAPTGAYSVPTFVSQSLEEGVHSFALRVLGAKNRSSAGYAVIIDALDVTGAIVDVKTLQPGACGPAIEESDARISWMGRWTTSTTSAASGCTIRSANVIGSAAEVSFEGTSAAWVGPMGPGCGLAEVFVDGVSQGLVDQYAPGTVQRQVLWSVVALADGRHTLRIRATGQKNSPSTGTRVSIDTLEVGEAFAPRYDENDGRTAVVGAWQNVAEASAAGGSYLFSATRDAHVVVRFTGTAVRWVGPSGPSFGRAEVHLDGRYVGVVDQYSAETGASGIVWAVAGLADTGHALVIRVLGESGPGRSGVSVGFDHAETTRGRLGATSEWTAGAVGLEDADSRIAWSGSWRAVTDAASSGGRHRVASAAGATLTSVFRGTGVRLTGITGPAHGELEVLIDGVRRGVVDTHSSELTHDALLFEASDLQDAPHVLVVRALGTASKESSGTAVAVDAVWVAGQPARVWDDRGSTVSRSASWSARLAPSTILGTLLSSGTVGATVTCRFIGSDAAVIAPRGPGYGKAEVLVDGVRRAAVDLYSPGVRPQGVVFSVTGLADGVHAITVRVLGTKSAASGGTTVAVDGFAVTGERVSRRGIITATARAQLNKQYVWAGSGPTVFDCSGLTSYAYRKAGLSIPHQSGYQFRMCSPQSLTWKGLFPGDLVFTSTPSYIHHVGVYVGFGLTINAPGTGRFVEYRAASTYGCYGRVAAAYWPGGYNGR